MVPESEVLACAILAERKDARVLPLCKQEPLAITSLHFLTTAYPPTKAERERIITGRRCQQTRKLLRSYQHLYPNA